MTFISLPFSILAACLLSISCQTSKQEQRTHNRTKYMESADGKYYPPAEESPKHEPVKLVPTDSISFEYTLGDSTKSHGVYTVEIECTVTNHSAADVNFLTETCNGLDYFLVCEPENHEASPHMQCNVSMTIIEVLKSGESHKFSTHIQQLEEGAILQNVGLEFLTVNRFYPSEMLWEHEHSYLVEDAFRNQPRDAYVLWN